MSVESMARDEGGWATEAWRLRKRVLVLEEALRPFAKAGVPLDKLHTIPHDATLPFKIAADDLRRAYDVLGDATFLGVDDIIRPENRHVDP